MSTHSLTVIRNTDGEQIAVMYRQHDGYPTGHGVDLAKFLDGFKIVNGIPMDQDNTKTANGMGCLAASIVAHFKKGIGDIYLLPVGTEWAAIDYIYEVREAEPFQADEKGELVLYEDSLDTVEIEVKDWEGKLLWEGSPAGLLRDAEKIENEQEAA